MPDDFLISVMRLTCIAAANAAIAIDATAQKWQLTKWKIEDVFHRDDSCL